MTLNGIEQVETMASETTASEGGYEDRLDEDELVESLTAESEHTVALSRQFLDAIRHIPFRAHVPVLVKTGT